MSNASERNLRPETKLPKIGRYDNINQSVKDRHLTPMPARPRAQQDNLLEDQPYEFDKPILEMK